MTKSVLNTLPNITAEKTQLIIGNPGCGKTTYLINRIVDLVRTGEATLDQIGFFSFSVAAMDEANAKALKVFDPQNSKQSSEQKQSSETLTSQSASSETASQTQPSSSSTQASKSTSEKKKQSETISSNASKSSKKPDRPANFRTLHSMAFKVLNLNKSSLVGPYQLQEFGNLISLPMTGASLERAATPSFTRGDMIYQHIDAARQRGLSMRAYIANENPQGITVFDLEDTFRRYEDFKDMNGLYDYTDMLYMARDFDYEIPELKYIFIDEAQDLSVVMWQVIDKFASKCEHIVIAGDDKQCINEYSAADVDTFLALPGAVTVLSQSYRVPQAAHRIADRIVQRHMSKYRKEGAVWYPRAERGLVKKCPAFPLNDFISLKGDTFILTRTRAQGENVAKFLIDQGHLFSTVFTVNGAPPVDLDIFRILSWLEDTQSGKFDIRGYITFRDDDTESMRQMKFDHIWMLKKYISCVPDDPYESMQKWETSESFVKKLESNPVSLLDKIPVNMVLYCKRLLPLFKEKGKELFTNSHIQIRTIHSSKGQEADNVIVCIDVPRKVKDNIRYTDDDSEAKLSFVAATRTKDKLILYGNWNQEYNLGRYFS